MAHRIPPLVKDHALVLLPAVMFSEVAIVGVATFSLFAQTLSLSPQLQPNKGS